MMTILFVFANKLHKITERSNVTKTKTCSFDRLPLTIHNNYGNCDPAQLLNISCCMHGSIITREASIIHHCHNEFSTRNFADNLFLFCEKKYQIEKSVDPSRKRPLIKMSFLIFTEIKF